MIFKGKAVISRIHMIIIDRIRSNIIVIAFGQGADIKAYLKGCPGAAPFFFNLLCGKKTCFILMIT